MEELRGNCSDLQIWAGVVDCMYNYENAYWELLNNEVRRVDDDNDNRKLTFTTRFRTIQNHLKFEDVVFHDEVSDLSGKVINYIEDVKADCLSDEENAYIVKNFNKAFSFDYLNDNGFCLYRFVCDKNMINRFVIAKKMDIVING